MVLPSHKATGVMPPAALFRALNNSALQVHRRVFGEAWLVNYCIAPEYLFSRIYFQ
jgi:hypothetical protein